MKKTKKILIQKSKHGINYQVKIKVSFYFKYPSFTSLFQSCNYTKKLTWTNRKIIQTKKTRQISPAVVENIQDFAN